MIKPVEMWIVLVWDGEGAWRLAGQYANEAHARRIANVYRPTMPQWVRLIHTADGT